MGVRETTQVTEVAYSPDDPKVRETAQATEVAYTPDVVAVRETALAAQVAYQPPLPAIRLTAAIVQVAYVGNPVARVTQLVTEVLTPNVVFFSSVDTGHAEEVLGDRTMAARTDTGRAVDSAIDVDVDDGVGTVQFAGRLEDLVGDAGNAWMRDVSRDTRALSSSASDPTEIAAHTADGSIDHTGWALIVVPEATEVRLTTEGSSVRDTLMFLYDHLPNAGSEALLIADDISTVQEPTLVGLPYDVRWSRIDALLEPGTYYICVLPREGSSFDWTTGKDLLLSVRRRA